MGPPSLVSKLSPIHGKTGTIEQVTSVKLLGVHLDANFAWNSHVEAISSKATQRLYFLKLLKRAGVPNAQLLWAYISIRQLYAQFSNTRLLFGTIHGRRSLGGQGDKSPPTF